MKEEMTFIICGRKHILPATPDPIDFPWGERDSNDLPTVDRILSHPGSENDGHRPRSVSPKRKRFRRKDVKNN